MPLNPSQEPPIDRTLEHYMESQALLIARRKASSPAERQAVANLEAARAELMCLREAHAVEATARRHVRGEVYSAARVAAINALGPTREALEENASALYESEPDAIGVLKAHARVHFGQGLVSQRLLLSEMPADIAPAARAMQAAEEAFAVAWMRCIDDPAFARELAVIQREAVVLFRTGSRPMLLVTEPAHDALDDVDEQVLGKAWSKLDALAGLLGVTPLSGFIAFSDEGFAAGAPAGEVLATVEALSSAARSAQHKLPSKKALLGALDKLRAVLDLAARAGGRAHFEVDV